MPSFTPLIRRAILAGTALACNASAVAACPVGYEAEGWNPGQAVDGPPGYRANVVITDLGADVCEIEWDLGGQHFSAVALYDSRGSQLHAS